MPISRNWVLGLRLRLGRWCTELRTRLCRIDRLMDRLVMGRCHRRIEQPLSRIASGAQRALRAQSVSGWRRRSGAVEPVLIVRLGIDISEIIRGRRLADLVNSLGHFGNVDRIPPFGIVTAGGCGLTVVASTASSITGSCRIIPGIFTVRSVRRLMLVSGR